MLRLVVSLAVACLLMQSKTERKRLLGLYWPSVSFFQSHMLVGYFTRLIRFVLSEWAYDDGVFVRWCMGGGRGRGRR